VQVNNRSFDASQAVYHFSGELEAIDRLKPGETVWVETMDAYGNQLTQEHIGDPVKLQGINPVTGPFYIEGAGPGDTLVIDILDVEVADQGTMYLRHGAGLYGELLDHAEIVKIKVTDKEAILPQDIRIPISPMIGVIGTAPAEGTVPTGIPGRHGGNMDTRAITTGASLYLPVFQEGALLALGDLHAAMGDGETGICGVEVRGRVKLRVDVVKGRQEAWPFLHNGKVWMAIASGQTLDEAVKEAGHSMLLFLQKRTGFSTHDLVRFLSAAGHLEISQVVNPLKTVRMAISKESFGGKIVF
jgi:amidase